MKEHSRRQNHFIRHPIVKKIGEQLQYKGLQLFNWINNRFHGLPQTYQKRLLLMVCMSLCAGSVITLIGGLKSQHPTAKPISIMQPLPLLRTKKWKTEIITEQAFQKIHRFKLRLDSLNKVDSSLTNKPLLDTIQFLENIYYEQHKK